VEEEKVVYMSFTGSTLFAFLILIVIVGFKVIEYQADKISIHESLKKKKAQNIVVSKNWLDFDRNTRTYNVSYNVADEGRYKRVCKFHYSDIYWDDESK